MTAPPTPDDLKSRYKKRRTRWAPFPERMGGRFPGRNWGSTAGHAGPLSQRPVHLRQPSAEAASQAGGRVEAAR